MKRKTKKCISWITVAALLGGITSPFNSGAASVEAADIPEPLVKFDFEDLSENAEITYKNAKATGEYSLAESYKGGGEALSLNGTGQFLDVKKKDGESLLTGEKELTVSYDAKLEKGAKGWILYASDSNKAPSYPNERYLGILHGSTNSENEMIAERYKNNGARPVSATADVSEIYTKWVHIDVVHSEKDTTIYVDGVKKATQGSEYAIDDILGENSILQIGKANWGTGEYCKGLIDNFRIYDTALTAQQVSAEYNDYVLESDCALLTLPETTDRSLTLPKTGASGMTQISWKSSASDVMKDDGTIIRGEKDKKVTMTATISLEDRSVKKEIEVTVLKKNPEEDVVTYTKELTLNTGFVSEDIELPTKVGDADVVWETSDASVITKDGKVKRSDENKTVTLTATIKVNGASKNGTKEFPLTVIAKGANIAAYVSNEPVVAQNGGMKIALQKEGEYEALHKDQPILYSSVGTKSYVAPQIFQKADGSFGVIAADGGNSGSVVLYDSKDLITYSNQRIATIEGITSIQKMYCVYDSADAVYKVFIEANGQTYITTSKNLTEFEEAKVTDYAIPEAGEVAEDAVWAEKEALTQKECDAIEKQFTTPYNTSLSKITKEITVDTGADVKTELKKAVREVTAQYSNGEEKTYSVRWNEADIEKADTDRAGMEYTVRGTIGGSAYYTKADSPLIEERADPYIVYDEERQMYYFTASYPVNGKGGADGYDRLVIREAKTIEGLADAEEHVIWDESEVQGYGRWIWAPELHKIGDSWYFLSTASLDETTGGNFNIRPFMMKCNNSEEITNPDSWGEPERVKTMQGDKTGLNAMSLDMTYFEAGGRHYLVWADFTKNDGNPAGISSLYIATIDPSNPTQLTSTCSVITVPEYVWELERYKVNEGPAVLQKDGKVYLAFSASGTGSEYCVGLLTGNADDDLTKKENWVKTPYPIMTSGDFNDELCGPGHNSFTVDEYGNAVIVYHARPADTHAGHTGDPLYDPCRHAYVKPVLFGADGAPVLNLSDEEFVKGGSEITVKVKVKGESEESKPSLEYNFDEDYTGIVKDSAGNQDGTVTEGASYVWDKEYGQVLYLDGDKTDGGHDSYLEFPEGYFDGKDKVTISMDVNEVTRSGNYFTFGVGQNKQKYLFLKTAPTSTKLAVTTSGYQNEKLANRNSVYPNNSRTWINIKMVVTPKSISLYQDGKLIAENLNTNISLDDLGRNLKAYIGKSFYSEDKYFRGYFDNIKVYDYAMTDEEVKKVTKEEKEAREKKMGEVKLVAEKFEIPNADNIKGNITLPSEKDGVLIQWSSSNPKVINPEKDGEKPAGVVTRQKEDTKVTLTAVFSKEGSKDVKKEYEVIVKAKAKTVKEEDYAGYLFVRFNGTEENGDQEQTYFSLSEDGLNWTDLNQNQPVLKSTIGESGLRDHFIARAPEGDKFYMIATDLSIALNKVNGGADWGSAGGSGSHSIVVWESDDLVNWSEPWLAEIAPEGAGCTWAPEFIYDETTGEYIVYWSATTLQVDEEENITQEYENHAIYYCKTRDFRTFTEAELYHDGGVDANGKIVKVIDSTMIQNGDTYYRFTKNESKGTIVMDKSDSILGEFSEIDSNVLSSELPAKRGAVEGPIIFKMNEKTEDGKDQWCLMVDRFARGQGYYPLITTDLNSGEFRMLDDSEYSFPSKYRHGYVMPVTEKEYGALQRQWGDGSYVDKSLLKEVIEEAKDILTNQKQNYTEESIQQLKTALESAKKALDIVTTTEEADQAAENLRKAIEALEKKEDILTRIEVTLPDKTEYQIGEELDLTGVKVTAVFESGKTADVTEAATVDSGAFNSQKAGSYTITVTYAEKTETFVVTVKENSPEIPDPVPSPKPEPNPDSNTKPKQNENKVVKTGDEQNPLLSISIFALASVVITGSFIRRKKYNL